MSAARPRAALGLAAALLLAAAPAPRAAETEAPPAPEPAVALFAGGCFWCMEPPFDAIDGVLATTAGYTGGTNPDPTYEEVSRGGTGHLEAVQVTYDPERVRYEALLDVFWRNVDPTDATGQFCDKGPQYQSAIFVLDETQRALAEASLRALEESGRFPGGIATTIRTAGPFFPAEEYHQDYYRKNPLRYKFYRARCGRDARLERVWGEAP